MARATRLATAPPPILRDSVRSDTHMRASLGGPESGGSQAPLQRPTSAFSLPCRALLRKLALVSVAALVLPSAVSLPLTGRADAQVDNGGASLQAPDRLFQSSVQEISGSGFTPGEIVHLSLNGEDTPLGSVVAGREGSFKTSVTIPDDAQVGDNSIIATGVRSGVSTQVIVPLRTPPPIVVGPQTIQLTKTGVHTVSVPLGATSVKITAYGAQGGEGGWPGGGGGLGAIVEGVFKLGSGDTDLTVVVGEAGQNGAKADYTLSASSDTANSAGGGGGGGSFVWLGTSNPPDPTSRLLIVAGGGGGGGAGEAYSASCFDGYSICTDAYWGRNGGSGRTARGGGGGTGSGAGAGGSGAGAGAGGEGSQNSGGAGGGGWATVGGDGSNGA